MVSRKSCMKNPSNSLLVVVLFWLSVVTLVLIQSADAPTMNVIWRKWTKTGTPGGGEGLLIGDVNNDGVQEIVYAGADRAVALRGTDGSYLWDVSVPGARDTTQPQMSDLDKDGYLEVVVPIMESPSAGFYILDGRTGSIEQKTLTNGRTDGSPVIGDIDGDGYPTLFFASMSYVEITEDSNSTGSLRSFKYNMGGSPRYKEIHRTSIWHPCSGGLSLADADHDGEFELYMGDRHMYYDRGYGAGVASFWAKNLTERWRHPDILSSSHIPILADVNKDGILDVISTPQRGGIAILNAYDGSSIRKELYVYNSKGQPVSGHYQSSIYDIDRDGNLELLMADGSHTITLDAVIWDLVKWREDARIPTSVFGQSYFGPQVGDVTGDGKKDILIAGYTGLYVFDGAHDPSVDGTYPLVDSETGLTSRLMYPVVQDIDNDGLAEVVVASQGGVIYAFDTPAQAPFPRPRTEVQFYSERRLGAAEYVSPLRNTAEPMVSDPSPANWAIVTPTSTTQLSFTLRDYQNNAMSYIVTTSPNIGSGSASSVSNGRFTISISGLAYSKTYKWYVKVTDGTRWTNATYFFSTTPVPLSNSPPTQDSPLLVSSSGANSSSDNWIASNRTTSDVNGNKVSNTYHWYRNSISTTNLLLPFNTFSPTTAKDYSGYGNNGMLIRNVTWTRNGIVGGAYSFNGGYITIPDSNTLDGNNQWYEMTAELWMYLTATQRGVRLLFKQPSYQIGFTTTGTSNRLYAGVWTPQWDSANSAVVGQYREAMYGTALVTNKWYHVAFTYKNGEGIKLYLNGVQVASASQSGYIQRGLQPVYLGWFDYFKGMIDEVKIYPKRLSAQQINRNYLQSKDGLSSSSTIVAGEVKTGETLKCEVIPSDSYVDGTAKMSNTVTVGSANTPPTATNLQIKPNYHHKTLDSADLVGSYVYYDANGDPESGTEIRWYRNGVLQSALNNKLTVPSSLTFVGDSWYFTVRPKDGKDFGYVKKSYSVKIVARY